MPPQAPAGFNAIPLHSDPSALDHTERMVRYHVAAANAQLRQAYWAFAAALALNRTLVLPRVGALHAHADVAAFPKCVRPVVQPTIR